MNLKTFFFLLIITLFVFALLAPVRAFEIREGDESKTVTVAKDTVVKGSLLAVANSVVIDGTINGDLYCAGKMIVIHGTVTGDVLCAGQTLDISGAVGGNIRSIGQLLTIAGPVKRNVVMAGQTVSVAPEGVISGEVLAAGQTINLNTSIGGDVNVAAQSVLLGEKAHIAGNFTYTSQAAVTEATGAAVVGKVSHIVPKKEQTKPFTANKFMPKANPWPARAAGSIVFYLIVGILVVLIAKEKVLRVTAQMRARPWFDGFVGFLTLVGAPIAIVMVAITIIGIPVAIILGIIFALTLVVSRVYVSVIVGNTLLSWIGKMKSGLVLPVVVGVIIVEILTHVPILGFLVSAMTTLWGLGGIVMSFGKRKKEK